MYFQDKADPDITIHLTPCWFAVLVTQVKTNGKKPTKTYNGRHLKNG